MRISVLLPALAAAAVLVLAGCSSQTPGNATPGDETPTGGPSIPTEPSTDPTEEPSTGGGGDSPLAGTEPCDLVPDGGAESLQLDFQEDGEAGSARYCRWRYEGATIDDSYTVDVAIFDELAMEDVVGTNVKPVPKIGGHDAVTYTPPAAGCAVSIAAGETSRVDVQAVGGDEQKGCQLAMQLATLVEPGLP